MEPVSSRLVLGTSLPEFQRQLDAAIAAPDVSTEAFVAMAVDEDRWLLDLAHLSEASVPPPISRTGRSQPWVLGIASFRGQVHTVMDMRQVLLGQGTVAVQQAWATPLNDRWGGSLALLWPQMLGLVAKPELVPCPSAPLRPWALADWQDASGQVWHEFDVVGFTASSFAGNVPGNGSTPPAAVARDTPIAQEKASHD